MFESAKIIYNHCKRACALVLGCTCVRVHEYVRSGNSIYVNLFATSEAVTYMMKLELHGVNLKI